MGFVSNLKYIYDILDRISEIQYNIGSGGAFETVYSYTYDAAGNLCAIANHVSKETILYKYDLEGKLLQSYAAAGIAAIAEDRESATSKEIAVSETNQKQQAFFPENPYSFSPKELRLEERPGTKNGKILQWVDPVSNYPIFEWDEDLRNGPHYHTMLPGWKGKHSGLHYKAGEAVPEPWNTIYFGG